MTLDDLSPEDEVDRALDALWQRREPASLQLDPSLTATMRDLIALGSDVVPPGARERVWQRAAPPTTARATGDLPPSQPSCARPVRILRQPRRALRSTAGRAAPLLELAAAAVLILALLGMTMLHNGGSLPGFTHSPAAMASPTPLAKIRWQFQSSSTVTSVPVNRPVVAGSVVLVDTSDILPLIPGVSTNNQNRDPQLHAIDAQTGKERWHYPVAQADLKIPPAVSGSTVYVCGRDNRLHALDTATGHERWQFRLHGSDCLSGPVAGDGIVIIGSADIGTNGPTQGFLEAVDAATGKLKWTQPIVPAGEVNSAVAAGTVYVTNLNQVEAFRATTGQPLWRTSLELLVDQPVAAGGFVYVVGFTTSEIIALDAATGKMSWQVPGNGMNIAWPGTVAHGLLFVGYANAISGVGTPGVAHRYRPVVEALDATTGNVRWRQTAAASSTPVSAVALQGNVVYAAMGPGRLDALDATTGAELWHVQLSTPALFTSTVTTNTIYIGSVSGILYAVTLP